MSCRVCDPARLAVQAALEMFERMIRARDEVFEAHKRGEHAGAVE